MKGDLLRAASLGLEIAGAVFVGAGVGFWVDIQMKSSPWCMVIGLFVGAMVGCWSAYKVAIKNEHS